MSEMVERVARALDPAAFREVKGHGPGECPNCDDNRREAFDQARDAISAMREPTDPMLWSVAEFMSTEISPWCGTLQGVAWTKMVDAALKD